MTTVSESIPTPDQAQAGDTQAGVFDPNDPEGPPPERRFLLGAVDLHRVLRRGSCSSPSSLPARSGSIGRGMLRESLSAQTAAVAIAIIGLNVHFGYTGLLNMGQSGFMMLGAYGFSISIWKGLPMPVGILIGLPGGVRLRAHPRRTDAEAARRLPGDRDDLGRRDPPVRRAAGQARGLHGCRPGHPGLAVPRARSRTCRSSATATSTRAAGCRTCRPPASTAGGSGSSPGCSSPSARTSSFLLVRSPWGRLLRGIREDEDAIRSLGKNVFAIKMQALIIGGLFGALAGMVYILPSSMQPDAMGRYLTFFCWTALLLGGAATVFGPVIGAILFFAAPHLRAGHVGRDRARQHHEHRPDRPVRVDLRRRRADAAGDLPTTRNPRRQEGAALQCLSTRVAGTPGQLADPEARRALMAGVPAEPGSEKPDPILEVDNIIRNFGGMTAVHVDHLEVQRGIITALIGPNGAGKTTFFNLITGFDRPSSAKTGAHWSFEGRKLDKTSASSRGPGRHGPHLPADQVPQPDDGDGQHDAGRSRPARREPADQHVQGDLGRSRRRRSRRRPTSCSTASRSAPRRTTTPAASRAASASCSRWPGR